MDGSRTVEPFEPILIQERGERRLAELRLPENPEQGGCNLVFLARQRGDNRCALGRVTIEGVGTGPEPELDQPSPFRRRQHEVGDFVQDHKSFGSTIQRRAVPVEAAPGSLGMDCHAEAAREGERCEAMPLGFRPGGAVG
jgi:hypothetical protein